MAGGIVLLGAFPELPFAARLAVRMFALALLAAWAVLACSYLAALARGTFQVYLSTAQNVFAIGTWVAATAVVGQVMITALPTARPLVYALGPLDLLLWLWYQWLLLRWLRPVATNPMDHRVTGSVLLSTVSTQALLLLAVALLSGRPARWLALTVLAVGLLSYVIGVVLIALRYAHHRGWGLIEDWDSTNCILYGALSITGLAAAESGALSGAQLAPLWGWTAVTFIIVEGVEVVRAVACVRTLGWRRGLLTYDVSQWARVFTVGMLYAFTTRMGEGGLGGWLALVQSPVIDGGQYVVLALFLAEVGLFVATRLKMPVGGLRRGAAPDSRETA
jgi:hypothetical protein